MKISIYVRVHIKMIPWKIRVLNPKNSWVKYPKVCEMFVYKHAEKIEYVKISLLFKKNENFTGE